MPRSTSPRLITILRFCFWLHNLNKSLIASEGSIIPFWPMKLSITLGGRVSRWITLISSERMQSPQNVQHRMMASFICIETANVQFDQLKCFRHIGQYCSLGMCWHNIAVSWQDFNKILFENITYLDIELTFHCIF